MASTNTGISWTDATWNCVVGCTKVSQGCKHCYAKTLHDQRHTAKLAGRGDRLPAQYDKPFEAVQLMESRLTIPLSWRKPRRIFVNSMSDLFHDDVPDAFLDRVFAVMALAARHTFQILTKRAERMRRYVDGLADRGGSGRGFARLEAAARGIGYTMIFEGIPLLSWPIPNVHLGVSVENQAAANERIPLLLQTPAAVRFLSCEPMLGPVDLTKYLLASRHEGRHACHGIRWVIAGGESGTKARPMHPDWARSLRDQCVAAGVPFHFKQWGEHAPTGPLRAPQCAVDRSGRVADGALAENFPADATGADGWQVMYRVGTKRAGRELDGRTWDEFPTSSPPTERRGV